jgi:two-component system copper resistance phosphate regulon response regulator CusR
MAQVLVIEDESRLRTFLTRTLQAEGHSVAVAATGPEGVRREAEQMYDLVVLDLMLPGFDGFEVLQRVLARDPRQRVLVLSAVGDVASRVRCLRMGAVDFLSKPFAAAELVERVRARLRVDSGSQRWLRVNDITLDLERQTMDVDGHVVMLSNREFILMGHLLRRAGEVCTRADLLAAVWGYTSDPGSNVVDVTIRRVRSKLPRPLIQTVRNVGYTLSAG